ncbi:MAG: hypothetical protein AAGE52_35885 [Myxococcota bacterium]
MQHDEPYTAHIPTCRSCGKCLGLEGALYALKTCKACDARRFAPTPMVDESGAAVDESTERADGVSYRSGDAA